VIPIAPFDVSSLSIKFEYPWAMSVADNVMSVAQRVKLVDYNDISGSKGAIPSTAGDLKLRGLSS
jgi:hypothetical protein